MVMLTAPDPKVAGEFYAQTLGCAWGDATEEECLLEGHGLQIVVSRGPAGEHQTPPSRENADIEIMVPMPCMEAAWTRDRGLGHAGAPVLDASGTFVYVTVDPGGNAISLITPLPTADDEVRPERITKRLKRPDFD